MTEWISNNWGLLRDGWTEAYDCAVRFWLRSGLNLSYACEEARKDAAVWLEAKWNETKGTSP